LFESGTRVSAQDPPNPCAAATNPPDATLELATRDGQARFHVGEIIGLSLAFMSTAPGKYQANTSNYDRSGRLDIDAFCIEPSTARDPLADYYAGGGFMGGGLFGYQAVSSTPYRIAAELNEWWSLPEGRYQVRVVSRRLERAAAKGESVSGAVQVTLTSNAIDVEIVPAPPEWQAAQLSQAIAALDSGVEGTAKHGARMIRFLGSEASTRELVRRYRAINDQPNGSDFMFGLFGSPERQIAIDAMKAAILEPAHPVSLDFIHTLSLLEMHASVNYRLPPFDPANRTEWDRLYAQKTAAYNAGVAQHVAELTAVIDKKTGSARGASVDALLTAPGTLSMDRAQLRRMLIDGWDSLPLRTRNELILWRWNDVGGPELLPLLRRIVNGPPGLPRRADQVDRGMALRRFYELAPDEGRELILREVLDPKGDIDIGVLGMLPDRELPALDESLIAPLRSRRTSDVNYQLVSRYASVKALAEVQGIYEPQRGLWACAPQTAMLRYFLRVAPDYGVAEVKTALGQRQFTHCYSMLLPDLKDAVADPRIEALAIAALDDSSSEVVRYAAEALGRYGSAAAEEPLWRRLTAFHEVWKDRVDELRSGPGGALSPHAADSMVEYALKEALSRAQEWLCGPDKLARLKALVTPMRQGDVDRELTAWQQTPLGLLMTWFGDGTFSYSAGPYSGNSVDALVRKLKQFPSGTHFVWFLQTGTDTRHRAEVDAVKAAANAAGLVVEIKSS
jgi:hypothetical protein